MSFIEKLAQERDKGKAQELPSSVVAANDNQCNKAFVGEYFSIDRLGSFPPSLLLRFPDGMQEGVPYSLMKGFKYNSEDCIEIKTIENVIKITGRNMQKLFDYINAYRVLYIKANAGTDVGEDGNLFVENIFITEIS